MYQGSIFSNIHQASYARFWICVISSMGCRTSAVLGVSLQLSPIQWLHYNYKGNLEILDISIQLAAAKTLHGSWHCQVRTVTCKERGLKILKRKNKTEAKKGNWERKNTNAQILTQRKLGRTSHVQPGDGTSLNGWSESRSTKLIRWSIQTCLRKEWNGMILPDPPMSDGNYVSSRNHGTSRSEQGRETARRLYLSTSFTCACLVCTIHS